MQCFSKSVLLVVLTTLLTGCGQLFELLYCDYGYGGVENQLYQTGVNLLDKCLALDHLDTEQKSKYLQGRAWAHYNLENNQQALDDQETAFKLVAPTQHYQFINYAAYLRRLKRFRESLDALNSAKKIDELHDHVSMMTQYNIGWSLHELGRYSEAIEAFTSGIPSQPDYPFVYLKRGLTYYKLGKHQKAQNDFSEFLLLVGDQEVMIPDDFRQELQALPTEYSRIRNL